MFPAFEQSEVSTLPRLCCPRPACSAAVLHCPVLGTDIDDKRHVLHFNVFFFYTLIVVLLATVLCISCLKGMGYKLEFQKRFAW